MFRVCLSSLGTEAAEVAAGMFRLALEFITYSRSHVGTVTLLGKSVIFRQYVRATNSLYVFHGC